MWGIFVGLLLSSVVLALDGQTFFGHEISISYLPGLLFICGGMLLANLREWRLTRHEWAMTGILLGVLITFISVSIVRAELAKPRVYEHTYTINAGAPREVVAQALAQIRQGKNPPAELVLLYGGFEFVRTNDNVQLGGWMLVVLGRERHVTLRSSREYTIKSTQIAPNHPGWKVTERSQCPPQDALVFLHPAHKGEDIVTLITREQGLPANELALLDQVDTYTHHIKSDLFALNLFPTRAQLGDIKRNALIKEFKFTAK